MARLPLFPTPPRAPVELTTPRSLTPACRACEFAATSSKVCGAPDGRLHTGRGGLLVLASHVQRQETSVAVAPFTVGVQALIRREILSLPAPAGGHNVVFDWAVRCAPTPSGDKADKARAKARLTKAVEACRPYTTEVLMQTAPARILAFGDEAARVLLGPEVPWSRDLRRGVGWLTLPRPTPVFLFPDPVAALSIASLRAQYLADVRWAATTARYPGGLPPWSAAYTVVDTPEELAAADAALRAAPEVSFDLETNGAPLWSADLRVTAVSLTAVYGMRDGAPDVRETFVWSGEGLNPASRRFAVLAALLHDRAVPKVGTNLKFDCNVIRHCFGVEVRGVVFDTLLAGRLLRPENAADLDTAGYLVGMGGHKHEAREDLKRAKRALDKQAKAEKKAPGQAWLFPGEKLTVPEGAKPGSAAYGHLTPVIRDRYAARDTVTSARVAVELRAELEANPPQHRLWQGVISRATEAFSRIESRGFPVDRARLMEVAGVVADKIVAEREAIRGYCPTLNPDSPAQIADYLYGTLGLSPPKTTASGAGSTDREALTELADEHPLAAHLSRYSDLTHIRGIYLDGTPEPGERFGTGGMLRHLRPDRTGAGTGWVVHTTFNLTGASTGRLSSSDPNLQNIPRAETELGALIKGLFVAPPGWRIVQADYSQLELRIAALLARDPKMAAIFKSGVDYHLRTAELVCDPAVWAKLDKDARKGRRSRAKAVNFGLLYGMRAKGLAKRMGCSVEEATETMNAILGEFNVLSAWIAEQIAEVRRTGEVWTEWNGERARCRDVHYLDFRDNVAVNTPVQGTASEFCYESVIEAEEVMRGEALRSFLIGTVHDSALSLAREDEVEEVAAVMRDVMESRGRGLPVPIVVDVDAGPSWDKLQPLVAAA